MKRQLFYKRFYYFTLALVVCSLVLTSGAETGPKLTALIIDGQNNHNWQGTTPVLKSILEQTGLFSVGVATSPPSGKPMDDFKPPFARYDVVVMNYTGDSWCDEAKRTMEEYMENGGGLVIYHAADNAFPEWQAYNEMIALGGWGGRDERSGPMVHYRDGQMVLDNTPGSGGTHGQQWAYPVETINFDHPITQGLPKVWRHLPDELYARMRGPAKNMTLLAVAKSKITNEYEPLIFTVQYGKGRVFHTMLGHDTPQLRSVGFAFTFTRGTEWAATGKVTQKELPDNFPTADEATLTLNPMSVEAFKQYDFGQSRKAVTVIEENIRIATPKQLEQIEALLLEVLNDDSSAYNGKLFACRMLRRMGTKKSIDTLAKFLNDDLLSDPARFALQGMAYKKVDRVFRQALNELDGDLKIGVIGSIAERGDKQAVPALLELIQDDNQAIAHAAIAALGKIGTVKAALALSKAEVPEALEMTRYDSILLCADKLLAQDKATRAAAFYKRLTDPNVPTMIRLAAYRGIILADQSAETTSWGAGITTIISILEGDDLELTKAAAGPFLQEIPGSEATKALADRLSSLPHPSQVLVLGALTTRADKAAMNAVVEAAQSENEDVQCAAIKALAVLGDASVIDRLARLASQEGETGKEAVRSLNQLSGEGIDKAILHCLESPDAKIRTVVIQSIIARHNTEAVPALLEHTNDSDATVREESLFALTQLAGEDDLPALLALLVKAEETKDQRQIEETIEKLATPMENLDKLNGFLLTPFDSAPATAKISLIRLLGKFGGEKAFEAVKGAMNDSNESVNHAALRAIANWPDASVLPFLMEQVQKASTDAERKQAIRGCIHAIELPNSRSIEETLQLYASTMALAKGKEEKALLIESLGERADFDTLNFVEQFLEDNDVAAEARKVYGTIINKLSSSDLDRSAWSATASHNGGNVKNAFDGRNDTRWDTATPQVPDMWFILDIGSQRQIEKIVLDSTRSSGDYPRGYEVYLSNDGENWGRPAAKGQGEKPVVEIPLGFHSGRFIKIVQTGKVDGLYWSIHELRIDAVNDVEKLKSAKEKLERLENK